MSENAVHMVTEAVSDIVVIDYQGNVRDLAYLRARYGNFVIQPAAAGEGRMWKVTHLYEKRNAAASIVASCFDEAGSPLAGKNVAFYWPDAPQCDAGPAGGVIPGMAPGRAVKGVTNDNGDVGFGLGGGAYYWPERGEIGPHALWMYGLTTRSDILLGLGMVAATNHDHFDVGFTRYEADPGPGPGPEPEPDGDLGAVVAELKGIRAAVEDLAAASKASRVVSIV